MKPHANARVPRQAFHKWQIGTLIGLLHDIVEIPDGLVRVDEQN